MAFGFWTLGFICLGILAMLQKNKEKTENLKTRPPVVVVLGHVDHGKSSLLEAIKDFEITSKESGGITQHVGAYEVDHQGKKITFIDTPGHEAFSAMRSRGAKIADIALLVVAADEGVKPQTKEAILHIKKAGIPLVAVVNKIDKSEAEPERVVRELSKEDVLTETMGGKVPVVEVSAKTKKGITDLLEMILLVAEMENLKADVSKPAEGVVIESYMDCNRGPIATLILRGGVLKKGDIVGTSFAAGTVKILEDFQGKPIEKALPSMPVIVMGFASVPGVGDKFKVFETAEQAEKEIKEEISPIFPVAAETDKKILNLIIKADFLGSLEAVCEVLKKLPQEKVLIRILKREVGEVNESDVKLARGAKAKILGFRVRISPIAKNLASRDKITIINFEIIYELVQAVRQLLEKMLGSETVRVDLGEIKILEIFKIEKARQIVGGRITDGLVKKGSLAEIFRRDERIGKGKIIGLQRQKKDVEEAKKGSECGILFEGNAAIEKGDALIVFGEERKKGQL